MQPTDPAPEMAVSPGRIKRQIQGREHRFALVCPPGLEDICLDEARALALKLSENAVAGPILEWNGRLEDLYRASLFMRTASRILVRLTEFRAGAREELFRHVADFPWELWLPTAGELRVDAHVEHSRISHEGMTATTVFEAVCRRFQDCALPVPQRQQTGDSADNSPAQRLIVHLTDNRALVSLDTSGEHLHRRGWRTEQGAAPIRENLAAGLLAWAGWPTRFTTLVDGMTGSGTLAIEALSSAGGWPVGGQAARSFAFCQWPSFMPERFNWLLRQRCQPATGDVPRPFALLACDLDNTVLAMARANEARFRTTEIPGEMAVNWVNQDFFDLAVPAGEPGLLVLNPPYGLRLSDGEGQLYPRLCRHLAHHWTGWTILLLGLPDSKLGPLAGRIQQQRSLRHGGLRLMAWLIR